MFEADVLTFLEFVVVLLAAPVEPVEPAAEDAVGDAAAEEIEAVSDAEDPSWYLVAHLQALGEPLGEVVAVVIEEVVMIA